MSQADLIFNDTVSKILTHGVPDKLKNVRATWKDGTPATTLAIADVQWKFDGSEVPILTNKRFDPEYIKAILELLWIWQQKSHDLKDLHDKEVYFWDSWESKLPQWKGTIGPAYGYQLAKKCRLVNGELLDQVDYLLHMLTKSPGSRRLVTTLWDPERLDEMAIEPCVWSTQWIEFDGKLNLTVNIRSNDICVGNPFNVFQYYVLQRMICQVTKIPIGTLTFNITNAHIYDRHIETVKEQIQQPIYKAPELWINPEVTNFYDFKVGDFQLIDSEFDSKTAKRFKYELAV